MIVMKFSKSLLFFFSEVFKGFPISIALFNHSLAKHAYGLHSDCIFRGEIVLMTCVFGFTYLSIRYVVFSAARKIAFLFFLAYMWIH